VPSRVLTVVLPVVLTAVVSGSLAETASAEWRIEEGRSGETYAAIEYRESNFDYDDVSVTILRSDTELLSRDLRPICRYCDVQPAGFGRRTSVRVRDLDADDEPEVLVDLYWGGAHCCFYSYVARFVPASGRYEMHRKVWGNAAFRSGAYRLRDFGRDERIELHGHDDRFAYRFTSYADSVFPIRIWAFGQGGFSDVTSRHKGEALKDARRTWRRYRSYERRGRDVRGALAAYLANMYSAGRTSRGWRTVRRAVRRGTLACGYCGRIDQRRYLGTLRLFLRRSGYAR
jgi:hypothetical protein